MASPAALPASLYEPASQEGYMVSRITILDHPDTDFRLETAINVRIYPSFDYDVRHRLL